MADILIQTSMNADTFEYFGLIKKTCCTFVLDENKITQAVHDLIELIHKSVKHSIINKKQFF